MLVVEGEQDVVAAQSIGAFAVTQAQGAQTGPEKADWTPLRGRPVLIVADKDEPGRSRAQKVAEHLAGTAASVTLAEAKDGKDLADHIAAGHDVEDLIGIGPVRTPVDSDPSAEFWESRTVLTHIRDTARILGASPWATLGCVLCRAAASVEPNVKLPAIVAGYASLNLFCAAAGESGLGKGAADRAARQAVRFVNSAGHDIPVMPLNPGTGEGLAKAFIREDENTGEKTTRALLSINEIRTLESLMGRQGATLDSQLLQVFSGESLGFNNASKLTTSVVAEHSYRLCVIVGVQPENAGSLLSAAKDGLPQRFMWAPVEDPYAPPPKPIAEDGDGTAALPVIEPHKVQITSYKAEDVIMTVPAKVVNKIRMDRHLRITGAEDAPLDSHRNLMQLKVAAALMILDGRCNQGTLLITAEDWRLAGSILNESDRVRSRMGRILAERTRSANRARALATAERDEIIGDRKFQRASDRILYWLGKGPLPRPDLNRKLKVDIRDYFDSAIAELIERGTVSESTIGRKTVYSLTVEGHRDTGTQSENIASTSTDVAAAEGHNIGTRVPPMGAVVSLVSQENVPEKHGPPSEDSDCVPVSRVPRPVSVDTIDRARAKVLQLLAGGQEMTARTMDKGHTSRDTRDGLKPALEQLLESGEIVSRTVGTGGHKKILYRLAGAPIPQEDTAS
ncbi:toprim domain-containing protein [Nocardia vinacea]|uniref:Toprim domain-containing protein n=1 Tax=Nocardia vinacea TaxID=96468 RepID=A0ABZ1Z165_9NOCA|nr:hypothetical protein [Nocardia vinacea]